MFIRTIKGNSAELKIEQLTDGEWSNVRLDFKVDGISGKIDCQFDQDDFKTLKEVLVNAKQGNSSEFESVEGNLFLNFECGSTGKVDVKCALNHQNGSTAVNFLIHSDLSYFN